VTNGGGVCPRCNAPVAPSQEYCVECGLRLPRAGRLGPLPAPESRLALPLALTLVAAVAGAVVAILLTRDTQTAPQAIPATGGSVLAKAPTGKKALAIWPSGTDAWSIVLISIPKAEGRPAARSIADQALQRGLPRVGILDSSRFASLHPGYWMVFTGVYETAPDANSVLQNARAVVKTARVQRITG
jgi:hypothetical protein